MTCSACCSRLICRPRLVRPPNMRSSSLAPSPAERRNDDMSLTHSRALHTTAVTRRLPFSHTRTDRRARGSDEGCAFRGGGPASNIRAALQRPVWTQTPRHPRRTRLAKVGNTPGPACSLPVLRQGLTPCPTPPADPSAASSPPPPPPPGFEDVAPGTHGAPGGDADDVAALAKAVEQATVTGESLRSSLPPTVSPTTESRPWHACSAASEGIDVPDSTLAAGPLLEEATEIRTVLAADATPYTSAQTFEDLNLSPELLKVRPGQWFGAAHPRDGGRARRRAGGGCALLLPWVLVCLSSCSL